jgi:hypothetical protein
MGEALIIPDSDLQKLEAQRDFDWLKEALENHSLPVIDRPKAVLELWDLWDKLKKPLIFLPEAP